MKKILLFFILFFLFSGVSQAAPNNKEILFTCDYYKPYDEFSVSKEVAVLCDIYEDFTHLCYVEVGSNKANRNSNKERLQNYGKAFGLDWKVSVFVKENIACPPYLTIKMDKTINGYELHGAKDIDHAGSLLRDLGGDRYTIKLRDTTLSTKAYTLIKNKDKDKDENKPPGTQIPEKDVTPIDFSELCQKEGVKTSLRFFGYLLLIVKILVPILLIVLGVIDFIKALVATEENTLQKSLKSLITRIIAGVVIFFIPTIVNFLFQTILNDSAAQYEDCRICVFAPNKCD